MGTISHSAHSVCKGRVVKGKNCAEATFTRFVAVTTCAVDAYAILSRDDVARQNRAIES